MANSVNNPSGLNRSRSPFGEKFGRIIDSVRTAKRSRNSVQGDFSIGSGTVTDANRENVNRTNGDRFNDVNDEIGFAPLIGANARNSINSTSGFGSRLNVPQQLQREDAPDSRFLSSRSISVTSVSSVGSIKADPDASRFTSKLTYPITDKTHPIYIYVSQLDSRERRELSRQFNELKATQSPDIAFLSDVDITMLILMRNKPEETSNILSMSLLRGSQDLKNVLQDNDITVSSLVIGAGPVGIATAAANGKKSTIVIDSNEVVGGSSFGGRHEEWWGQNAAPTVGFSINSTSRLPNSDVPKGGAFDFNPGPLQIAKDLNSGETKPGLDAIAVRHVSGDSWPDASALAQTLILNATTIKNENNTEFLLGFKVDKVNYNQSRGLYEVSAVNRAGERVQFNTLSLTQAAGIGKPQVPNISVDRDLPNPLTSADLRQEVDRTSKIIQQLNSSDPADRTKATLALKTVKVLTPQQWFDITKYSEQPSRLYQGRKPGFVGDGDSIFTVFESIYRLRGRQSVNDSAGNYTIKPGIWFTGKFVGCKDLKDAVRSRYADIQTVAGRTDKGNGLQIKDRLDCVNKADNGEFACQDINDERLVNCDFLVVGTGYDIGTKPVFDLTGAPQQQERFARDENGEPLCFNIGPNGILVGPATGPAVNNEKKGGEGTLGIKENTASVFLRAKDGATAQISMMNSVADRSALADLLFAEAKSVVNKPVLPSNRNEYAQFSLVHSDNGINFNQETAKSAIALALPDFNLDKGAKFTLNFGRQDKNTVIVTADGLSREGFNALWSKIPKGGQNHILSSVSLLGEESQFSVDVTTPKRVKRNDNIVQSIKIDFQQKRSYSDQDSIMTIE